MNYKNLLLSLCNDPILFGDNLKYSVEFGQLEKGGKLEAFVFVKPKEKIKGNIILRQGYIFKSGKKTIEQAYEKVSKMMVMQLLKRGLLSLNHTHSEPFLPNLVPN